MKCTSKEWPIKAPWGKITLRSSGDPQGVPVFLAHGRQDCAATFEPLLKKLPTKQFYYLAIDMPGSSTSDPLPIGEIRSINKLARNLVKVLNFQSKKDGNFPICECVKEEIETNKLSIMKDSDESTTEKESEDLVDEQIIDLINRMMTEIKTSGLVEEEGTPKTEAENASSVSESMYHTCSPRDDDYVVIDYSDASPEAANKEVKEESSITDSGISSVYQNDEESGNPPMAEASFIKAVKKVEGGDVKVIPQLKSGDELLNIWTGTIGKVLCYDEASNGYWIMPVSKPGHCEIKHNKCFLGMTFEH